MKKLWIYTIIILLGLLSYGYYLSSNLPNIIIKDKAILIEKKLMYNMENKKISEPIPVKEVFSLLLPEKRYFHNKTNYSFMAYVLWSSSIIYEKYLKSYSVCFSDYDKSVLISTLVEDKNIKSNISWFKYRIYWDFDKFEKEFKDILIEKNFPIKLSLIKWDNCKWKLLKNYELNLAKWDYYTDKDGKSYITTSLIVK